MGEPRIEITPVDARADDSLPLIAYHESGRADLPIVPAPRSRDWIDSGARHARHCLPLMIGGQAGWFILNNRAFTVRWDGGERTDALTVEYDDEAPPRFRAHSAFGYGILSFMIPYLFRTPSGVNLHVRGPANVPRDGIWPLDAIVETDWAVQTFTMNWKLTRADTEIRFEQDDPVCMIVPQERGYLERFAPQTRAFDENPALRAANAAFNRRRHESLVRHFVAEHVQGAAPPAFEKDYMRGATPAGDEAPEHQRKLNLRPFRPSSGSGETA